MKTRRMKGYTVMELVIIMAIMGTMLSLAVLSIREHRERTKLRSAAEMVAADIRHARWIAKTRSHVCTIAFNVSNNTYTVNGDRVSQLPNGLKFGVDPSVTSRPSQPSTAPPPDGISFGSGSSSNIARFHPVSGAVTTTGTVYLTDGTRTMAVSVSIYGRPKIWVSAGGRKWAAL